MGAYKRNDPELQEEETATAAPSGKVQAPKVHEVTRQAAKQQGRAPRRKRNRGLFGKRRV